MNKCQNEERIQPQLPSGGLEVRQPQTNRRLPLEKTVRRADAQSEKQYGQLVTTKRFCNVEGCSNKHFGRGFCQKHYNQHSYAGDINTFPKIFERGPIPTDSEIRFWKYVKKSEGCWIWTGAKKQGGYGVITVYRDEDLRTHKRMLAHRLSWEIHNGKILDGLCVCHHCDNPPCVNPAHLFLGTMLDNTLDCYKKGRMPSKRRTHCSRGHELTYENRYIHPDNPKTSECRICIRFREAKNRKKKEELYDMSTCK